MIKTCEQLDFPPEQFERPARWHTMAAYESTTHESTAVGRSYPSNRVRFLGFEDALVRRGDGGVHGIGKGSRGLGYAPGQTRTASAVCSRFSGYAGGARVPGAEDGKYSNTPATDFFLDQHKPAYPGG